MKNTNLVLIPSRSRPNNVARLVETLKKNSRISDILVVLDGDDPIEYPPIEGVMYETFTPRLYTVAKINAAANLYVDKYETITFMGDDQVVHTEKWDLILYEPLELKGYGISYGDDGFQGSNIGTSVMMTTNIIKCLGFMGLPTLVHLYVDNFWRHIGHGIKSYWYFPQVQWEHLHYLNNKAEIDDVYRFGNSPERYEQDGKAYDEWLASQAGHDIVKLLKKLQGEK